MNISAKSPRVARSPKLKAKWLSNTLAYQYAGTREKKRGEIIVLTNDLDQYLQDIFQSIDTHGRGKISKQEFQFLCDVLYLKDKTITRDLEGDISFSQFHGRLCEHFACYGDFTGFLVNQNFRSINVNKQKNGSKVDTLSRNNMSKRTEFQKKLANSNGHTCKHDTEIFKNWDKLRLSGFRLSEIREHIDSMLYEVAFHKEEAQSLKEIIEDLRSMLQSSDAQNIGMQVALKKTQKSLTQDADKVTLTTQHSNRYSLPFTNGTTTAVRGEQRSLLLLTSELTQLRGLRDKEVSELINFNNQLQYDITELSSDLCAMEDENKKLKGQMDAIVKTYTCCRQVFAVCVESFREVEIAGGMNYPITPPPSADRKTHDFPARPDTADVFIEETDRCQPGSTLSTDVAKDQAHSGEMDEELGYVDDTAPEHLLIKNMQQEVLALKDENTSLQKEMARQEKELLLCRRHLDTAHFQVEALETECSRLLAMEDQLVSVFTLLQKGRVQRLSRKTLGQLLLDVIDSSFGEDGQDMTASQFLRCLHQSLMDCPLLMFSSSTSTSR